MSGTEDQNDRKFDKVMDRALKIAIPILFWSFGYAFNSIKTLERFDAELDKRISIIEGSRYRMADAERDREALRAEIRSVASRPLPDWFREQVGELANIARMNSKLLQEIDKRLVRLESK